MSNHYFPSVLQTDFPTFIENYKKNTKIENLKIVIKLMNHMSSTLDQCTLEGPTDKNSLNNLHFQCIVGHEIGFMRALGS